MFFSYHCVYCLVIYKLDGCYGLVLSQISECCMLIYFRWIIFQGRDSSDGEELDGAPDDDEYDTEDSFIDDVELVSIDILRMFFFCVIEVYLDI